ncbi:hypothetical protein C7212DRAFT_342475 [Tuber magnatum]|uniref:Uncharacterized protein n=1 Tax=Tuber magnatum TaxID=42249 RepID=A0A317STX3_9PEZI|nr:hypothetical protein C7212DRAFT_342475 [Tuber magnatum]
MHISRRREISDSSSRHGVGCAVERTMRYRRQRWVNLGNHGSGASRLLTSSSLAVVEQRMVFWVWYGWVGREGQTWLWWETIAYLWLVESYRHPRRSLAIPHVNLPYLAGPDVLYNDCRPEVSWTRVDRILPSRPVQGSWQSPRRPYGGPGPLRTLCPPLARYMFSGLVGMFNYGFVTMQSLTSGSRVNGPDVLGFWDKTIADIWLADCCSMVEENETIADLWPTEFCSGSLLYLLIFHRAPTTNPPPAPQPFRNLRNTGYQLIILVAILHSGPAGSAPIV